MEIDGANKIEPSFFDYLKEATKDKATFITFAGPIGVGKSTMANKLSKKLGCRMYLEKVEGNPQLESFYNEMSESKSDNERLKTAFPLQISLLSERLEQHRIINNTLKPGEYAVQDRSIYEDVIFTRMLCDSGRMSREDGQLYVKLFSTVYTMLHHPHIIIYLRASPETCFDRINTRKRPMEKITFQYIQQLCCGYDSFFDYLEGKIPLITIDYNKNVDVKSEQYDSMVDKLIEEIKDFLQMDKKPSVSLSFS